jgi:hypothetical protein
MGKNYWTWTCHRCGEDDNRNTNRFCVKCGAQIRCQDAGGHYWDHGERYCSNGCGKARTGEVDLSQRRADY